MKSKDKTIIFDNLGKKAWDIYNINNWIIWIFGVIGSVTIGIIMAISSLSLYDADLGVSKTIILFIGTLSIPVIIFLFFELVLDIARKNQEKKLYKAFYDNEEVFKVHKERLLNSYFFKYKNNSLITVDQIFIFLISVSISILLFIWSQNFALIFDSKNIQNTIIILLIVNLIFYLPLRLLLKLYEINLVNKYFTSLLPEKI